MKINIDGKKLNKLIKSFSILTGIRIVVFDTDFNILAEYPSDNCLFCSLIQKDQCGYSSCQESNSKAFKLCSLSDDLYLYTCHAGLKEAMVSLKSNEHLVGFIMFGQVLSSEDSIGKYQYLYDQLPIQINNETKKKAINQLKSLTNEQIESSKTILLSLAKYAMSERMLSIAKDEFISKLDEYIYSHLGSKIITEDLCSLFHISRTALYETGNKYLHKGIALYIAEKKIEKSKELLANQVSIKEVAYECGFNDTNYFSKVFKKKTKLSPKKFQIKEASK